MDAKTNPAPEGRKALGRGLAALLNTGGSPQGGIPAPAKSSLVESEVAGKMPVGERLQVLALDKIEANPHQPRRFFNEERLKELALSLKEQGLIQPIVVRRLGTDKFQIVAGERRWRASKIAGLLEIPVIIREDSKGILDNDLAALAENIQREELNAIELAQAYDRAIKTHQLTQEQLAEKVGVSRASVANTLRLLKLPEDVQKLVVEGKLSEGHSRALLSLQTETEISKMAGDIVTEKLSVRDVESRVRMKIIGHTIPSQAPTSVNADTKKPEILAVEEELRQIFGTKVAIRGGGDRGTLELYYTGSDSFNRILHLIRGLKR